jgi:hypothetical protein
MIKLGIAISLAAEISGGSGFIAGRTTAPIPQLLHSRPRPYRGSAAMGCGGRYGGREPFV